MAIMRTMKRKSKLCITMHLLINLFQKRRKIVVEPKPKQKFQKKGAIQIE